MRKKEGRQRKGGRERKGAFTNTTKLQIWLPTSRLIPAEKRRRALNSSHLPTPQQPGPQALSPRAEGHTDQKLNRTREAQNLLCTSERESERDGKGRGQAREGEERGLRF